MCDMLLESTKKKIYSFDCNYQKIRKAGDTGGSIQQDRKRETEHIERNEKK